MKLTRLAALLIIGSAIFAAGCEEEKDGSTYCGPGTTWKPATETCEKGKPKSI